MTTPILSPPGYTPLDAARNVVTVAAAIVLSVFHRDVSGFVPAAMILVAGCDVVATQLAKTRGGILHRLETAIAGLARTVGAAVAAIPAGALPPTVAKDAAEVATAAGDVGAALPAEPPPVKG